MGVAGVPGLAEEGERPLAGEGLRVETDETRLYGRDRVRLNRGIMSGVGFGRVARVTHGSSEVADSGTDGLESNSGREAPSSSRTANRLEEGGEVGLTVSIVGNGMYSAMTALSAVCSLRMWDSIVLHDCSLVVQSVL
jgi:hypothetical protein